MSNLAARNRLPKATLMGAGAYHHIFRRGRAHDRSLGVLHRLHPIPGRDQPGILQAIYEYQTMINPAHGTKVANASMYDGATAMASGRAGRQDVREIPSAPGALHSPEYGGS